MVIARATEPCSLGQSGVLRKPGELTRPSALIRCRDEFVLPTLESRAIGYPFYTGTNVLHIGTVCPPRLSCYRIRSGLCSGVPEGIVLPVLYTPGEVRTNGSAFRCSDRAWGYVRSERLSHVCMAFLHMIALYSEANHANPA